MTTSQQHLWALIPVTAESSWMSMTEAVTSSVGSQQPLTGLPYQWMWTWQPAACWATGLEAHLCHLQLLSESRLGYHCITQDWTVGCQINFRE